MLCITTMRSRAPSQTAGSAPIHCREEPTWLKPGQRSDPASIRSLRDRFEPFAHRRPPFTTIADFSAKRRFFARYGPKDAPLGGPMHDRIGQRSPPDDARPDDARREL